MSLAKKSISIILLSILPLLLTGQKTIPDEISVNYSCEDKALRDVLFELSEITGVTIAWQEQIMPSDSAVSISVRNEKLGQVLSYLIFDHGLTYKIVGSQLAIVKDKFREAENYISVSGYIKDKESGEVLLDAYVYSFDKSEYSFTNAYGFFSLDLPKDTRRIYASYLGYERAAVELELLRDTLVYIEMNPSNYIREIVISDSKIKSLPVPKTEIGNAFQVSMPMLNRSLPLAGEPDLIRNIMSSPGVSGGADGFGGISVRGGSENQNLSLLDGVPVYNAQHAFGLLSIFNSSIIKSAKLYKGPMPAHYSGRLSSVLDVRTKDGNMNEVSGQVSLGLLSARAFVEGPLIKDKVSILVSARRTLLDPWIQTIGDAFRRGQDQTGQTRFYFYDINSKINLRLSDKSRLNISYYEGSDLYDNQVTNPSRNSSFVFKDTDQLFWNTKNQLASLRWQIQFSHKLFLNTSIYKSKYLFNSFDHDRLDVFDSASESFLSSTFNAYYYQSHIDDLGSRLEFDYHPDTDHKLKFGATFTHHNFQPAFKHTDQLDSLKIPTDFVVMEDIEAIIDKPRIISREYEFYISDEIALGEHARLSLGYNHLMVETHGQWHSISQPRVLFMAGSGNHSFRFSWGRMGQFMHSLVNSGIGIPFEIWLPTTNQLRPEQSWMLNIGHSYKTSAIGEVSLDLFYNEMKSLTRYSNLSPIEISSGSNWEELLPLGEGRSYGMELGLRKEKGNTLYNASYTLSWSDRRFDSINDGDFFRFRYDRRHMLNLSLVHRINQDIDFSLNWQYASGAPVTLPDGSRYFELSEDGMDSRLVLVYDGINNTELPAYHRLDIGFNFRSHYKWGNTQFTLGIYNVYNRRNTFYRDIQIDFQSENYDVRYEDVNILPILPSVNYTVNF